jgi:hypothetical protein
MTTAAAKMQIFFMAHLVVRGIHHASYAQIRAASRDGCS